MSKVIGISQFLERNFVAYDFDGKWKASFGYPEKNFKMFVYGESGNGKTSFCVQLAKYMARFTRVLYNSFEEGISKSLQEAIKRENLIKVNGRIMFGKLSFKELIDRLSKPRSERVIIIDSRDYMHLTQLQYIQLVEKFPRKCFIITGWSKNGSPKGEVNKAIQYMADIKVYVDKYIAEPRCRYGGNQKFVIWERKAKIETNKKERNLWNDIPNKLHDEYYLQVMKNGDGTWYALYESEITDHVLYESDSHFVPELAISDLLLQIKT